jgi:hypothetical protein
MAKKVPPLSATAERVLNRVPAGWTNEHDVRRDVRDGLFLRMRAIAQILNHLERRGLIQRGAWLADGRPIRRTVPVEALDRPAAAEAR